MYKNYFGLLDEPFRMTPDTRYLFRSLRHEEAISSLLYGIGEKKGFIVITGEIGTGKTTLCRALLNHLDEKTKTAVILNPALSREELLHAILDDLGIEMKDENPTQKKLLDRLNEFLIEQAHHGHNVAVIIDEAQNLDTDVLEHIRMLSNLETEQEKLLQIILVGQPELNEILKMDRLEQLRQRIAVRYHIEPLAPEEISTYIRHRLMVAGNENAVQFEKGAINAIAEYTRGTPRLINVICDKCLLAAYALDTKTITEPIARKAIADHEGPSFQQREQRRSDRELVGVPYPDVSRNTETGSRFGTFRGGKAVAASVLVIGILGLGLLIGSRLNGGNAGASSTPETTKVRTATATADGAIISSSPAVAQNSVSGALAEILALWGVQDPNVSNVEEAGMTSVRILADPATLSRINLPALITTNETTLALLKTTPTGYVFYDPARPQTANTPEGYVNVSRFSFDQVGLVEARIPLPAHWGFSSASRADARLPGLVQKALQRVTPTGWNTPASSAGESYSSEAVMRFQAAVGLPVDGIIGPITWCALVSYAHPNFPELMR